MASIHVEDDSAFDYRYDLDGKRGAECVVACVFIQFLRIGQIHDETKKSPRARWAGTNVGLEKGFFLFLEEITPLFVVLCVSSHEMQYFYLLGEAFWQFSTVSL